MTWEPIGASLPNDSLHAWRAARCRYFGAPSPEIPEEKRRRSVCNPGAQQTRACALRHRGHTTMIETRYPGVFLNEVAFDAKPIEGVPTSNAHLADMTSLERLTSAPESKYVNERRYVAFLEESIGKAIQFAVFEPNGEALWQKVRDTVSNFLFNQWQSGALVGTHPEEAYFVKCDRSTMTQNDLDNGRLIIVIGVATVRPAEFVMLRISALTASASP
jgi:hypothetical protein